MFLLLTWHKIHEFSIPDVNSDMRLHRIPHTFTLYFTLCHTRYNTFSEHLYMDLILIFCTYLNWTYDAMHMVWTFLVCCVFCELKTSFLIINSIIYNKNINLCQIMYHINPRPLSAQVPKARGLVLDSRIDMETETNFAIYYFLIISRQIY